MTIETHTITVSGVPVAVVRKPIKNLHLGVYPPDGRVRVAAPLQVSNAAVRVAVIGKLRWIRQQQAAFNNQARQTAREMVDGESHYFLGRRYRLRVVEAPGSASVNIRSANILQLTVPSGSDAAQREDVLYRWYRQQLRVLVTPLLDKWQATLAVSVTAFGIKKMKTRWGTCNVQARRIWLNLELAKKPPECLEYLVVHELVHFLVQTHDQRFHQLMNKHLPNWQQTRQLLNAAPLAYEDWSY